MNKSNSKIKFIGIISILMIASIFFAGCTQSSTRVEGELLILASSFPLYEFTREIAGNTDDVKMMVPPGVDVHHYDLRPSDLRNIEEADLIIFTGEEMEPWLDSVLEIEGRHKNKIIQATKQVQLLKSEHDDDYDLNDAEELDFEQLIEKIDNIIHAWEDEDLNAEDALEEIERLIHNFNEENELIHAIDYKIHEWEDDELTANDAMEEIEELIHEYEEQGLIELDGHTHSEYDPHVWLDFENSIEIVNAIVTKLSQLRPENEDAYRANADAYIIELRRLHQTYQEGLETCEIREFITNHDSFGYLAIKYDLKQIPISGLSAEQEPSPRAIANIIQEAREHDIKHVYFEELASPRVSDALAREIGAQTLMLTPAENIPAKDFGEKTFIDLMYQNLDNLKTGLRCS